MTSKPKPKHAEAETSHPHSRGYQSTLARRGAREAEQELAVLHGAQAVEGFVQPAQEGRVGFAELVGVLDLVGRHFLGFVSLVLQKARPVRISTGNS